LQPLCAAVPRAARTSAHRQARAGRRNGRGRSPRAREIEPIDAGDAGRSRAVPRGALRVRGDPDLPRLRVRRGRDVTGRGGGGRAELRAEAKADFKLTPPDEEVAAETPPPAHVPIVRGLVCPKCARGFDAARPALFSYNSPLGACGDCRGFGRIIGVDWAKVIPDGKKTLAQGAIKAWNGSSAEWERAQLKKFAQKKKIPMDVPWDALTAA